MPQPKRKPETQAAYNEVLRSGRTTSFVEKPAIREFTFWKVINNEFPYDNIAGTHHMLVPKREVPQERFLNDEERREMVEVKEMIGSEDDMFMECPNHARTVKGHMHIHLITWL